MTTVNWQFKFFLPKINYAWLHYIIKLSNQNIKKLRIFATWKFFAVVLTWLQWMNYNFIKWHMQAIWMRTRYSMGFNLLGIGWSKIKHNSNVLFIFQSNATDALVEGHLECKWISIAAFFLPLSPCWSKSGLCYGQLHRLLVDCTAGGVTSWWY